MCIHVCIPVVCINITTMGQCLASKDGRDTAQLASKLKVEPCVWFGGGRCNHFNSSSGLCEPFGQASQGGSRWGLGFQIAGCSHRRAVQIKAPRCVPAPGEAHIKALGAEGRISSPGARWIPVRRFDLSHWGSAEPWRAPGLCSPPRAR